MRTLHCVIDREPPDGRELLRASCLERGLRFNTVRATGFDFSQRATVAAGDLAYQSATSPEAGVVYGELRHQGAITLRDARVPGIDAHRLLEQAGVPTVPAIRCPGRDRGTIRRAVEAVGGLPVVVKVPGGEGGVGVMLAESWRSLVSLLDYLRATGVTPILSQFIANASHWRCITLGNDVLASYLNEPVEGDFRTTAPTERIAFDNAAPAKASQAAVTAAAALGVEFAGVDVLIAAGDVAVIEVNSPCYFAAAQVLGTTDVSGAIVDRLLANC